MVCILWKITMLHWYYTKSIRYKIKFSSNCEISSLKRAASVPVSPLRMPFISLRRSREAVFRRPVVLGQGCQSQVAVVCSSAIFFYSSNFTRFYFFLWWIMYSTIQMYPIYAKKNSRNNFEFTTLSSSEYRNQEQENFIFYCSGFFIFRPECLTSTRCLSYWTSCSMYRAQAASRGRQEGSSILAPVYTSF